MTFLVLNAISSYPISPSLRLISSCLKPKTIPARDTVIDFGKHKGKMLGTLPLSYLKWVSNNLRARHFEHWAKLADQVLQDPVYQDRIEWELAANVLHGNNAKATAANDEESSAASAALLEISERFGWDNEDKAGWRKVKFELLGTSKGGRIPRVAHLENSNNNNYNTSEGKEVKEVEKAGEKRRERRERVRLKREDEINSKRKIWGSSSHGVDKNDRTVEIYNPFPGRQALLNKVLNNRTR